MFWLFIMLGVLSHNDHLGREQEYIWTKAELTIVADVAAATGIALQEAGPDLPIG